ncbi:MAG TPA: NTP transferase domain-containing protein, partial [Candidatus Lustribacter sp.]|nr:NTP transferase domain-containing protein [Candidatus Lustribacter sp.]
STVVGCIVLAGGTSRRHGGADKTRLVLGGSTVLDTLLGRLPAAWPVVVVGEERPTNRTVSWTREAPGYGGPLAGIAAGLVALALTTATPTARQPLDGGITVVVAGDMPFAGAAAAALAEALAQAAAPLDAVMACDGDGRDQPLLAAYRTDRLRAAIPADPQGKAVRPVLRTLTALAMPVDERSLLDIDTPEALARARRLAP